MKLDELRKIAEAATPGPWQIEYQRVVDCIPALGYNFDKVIADTVPTNNGGANLKYIAAFNPATALRLLELIEDAEKMAEFYTKHSRHTLMDYGGCMGPENGKTASDFLDKLQAMRGKP